ncbi:DUF308 domain-containing protein [Flavobacterium agricola]|uniref:DUF308 domain-containing protein n=1 Tax=Flavobacterium agricola TaxID=2870839 RepID=A0ABY6M2T7_9FLAO|nr:DUF308 domain-containing protein [Flavobacterium agricola]UYW01750.1 DUF308 domain-containing protein [Flavobacterium agricola]
MTFTKSIKNSIKHWWVPLLAGLLFIFMGAYSFYSPMTAYESLTIVFTITFLFSGLSEVSFAIANRHEIDNWGWTLAWGLLTAVIGFILFVRPLESMEVLAYFIGFWVLFRSVSGISYSIDLKHYGTPNWGSLLALSILGVFVGLIMILNPVLAGFTAVIWLGCGLVIVGVFAIALAFNLKGLKAKN